MKHLIVLCLAATTAVAAPVPPPLPPDPFGRAFMGVIFADGPIAFDSEVFIKRPIRGLPAERAGIRPGDRLVRVGLTPVTGQGQVMQVVRDFRPGAVVEVEIERKELQEGELRPVRKVFRVHLIDRPPPSTYDDDIDDD